MSKRENRELTKAKMQVYEIVFTMFIKLILVVAGLVAFFVVLYFLINTEDNTAKVIYSCLNTLLGGSIYLVYRHYFPDNK